MGALNLEVKEKAMPSPVHRLSNSRSNRKPTSVSINSTVRFDKRPVLIAPNLHTQESRTLYDRFVKAHNESMRIKHCPDGDVNTKAHLGYCLRTIHAYLFNKILSYISVETNKYRRRFNGSYTLDPNNEYVLILGRTYLADLCSASEASVSRALNRLEEAGVLSRKIYRQYTKENTITSTMVIKINPSILVFEDIIGKKMNLAKPSVNRGSEVESDSATCTLYNVLELFNKEIKDKAEKSKQELHKKQHENKPRAQHRNLQEHYENHHENEAGKGKSTDTSQKRELVAAAQEAEWATIAASRWFKSQSVAGQTREIAASKLEIPRYNPQVGSDWEREKLVAMQFIYSYANSQLYKNRNVASTEMVRAQQQMYKQHFLDIDSDRKLVRKVSELRWRIDYAHRFMSSQNWQPCMPFAYFDKENVNRGYFGFHERKWLEHRSENQKKLDRKHYSEKKVVMKRLYDATAVALIENKFMEVVAKSKYYLDGAHPYWHDEYCDFIASVKFKETYVKKAQERFDRVDRFRAIGNIIVEPEQKAVFLHLSEMVSDFYKSKSLEAAMDYSYKYISKSHPQWDAAWREYVSTIEWCDKWLVE